MSRKKKIEPKYTFVNMDKKLLKNGGRKAIKLSKDDFKKKLYEIVAKTKLEYFDQNEEINENNVYYRATYLPKVKKDISKILFDDENIYFKEDGLSDVSWQKPKLLGLHTLENGLTFIGYWSGGDWEELVFYIIYYDGKDFRGYIPSYGNLINFDTKTAFGSEGENENISEIFSKKYATMTDENTIKFYHEKQGCNPEGNTIVPNFEAIKEDIESRIIVK